MGYGGRGKGYRKKSGREETYANPFDDIEQVEDELGSPAPDPMESVVATQLQKDDEKQENVLRPKRLMDFLGQPDVKKNLAVYIQAAKQRGEALDHVFLFGPPGLGKTTLASIIANEMGVSFKSTTAPALDKPKDLAGILTNMDEGAVFFIDEIHRLKPAIAEMLYKAMEDFQIDWVIGQGPAARTMTVPIQKFTLIAATTKAGGVSQPLIDRFGINLHLEYYTDEELSSIVTRSAKLLGIQIEKDATLKLAHCSRGTPRVANRLIKRIRDYATVENHGIITKDIVDTSLKRMGIDERGLDKQDRRILRTMIENYQGGPVGLDTLSIAVGEPSETMEDYYEPYLIQKGYLQRTPRGRVATVKAYELFGLKRQGGEGKSNADQGILF